MKTERTSNIKDTHSETKNQALQQSHSICTPANDELYQPTLSEVFNNEIDAWARHAMASNGFG